ncbi:MAG: phosphatidylserine decarboxylase [Burkholderiaceae bacterium]|nr:phosphatidylserine decarboxylase [Burkholderiaceae bacterium]
MSSPRYPHPIVAREGWPYIGLAFVVALAVSFVGGWWSIPLWLIALFVLQFFRDPPRDAPAGERLVLAPADGRVISIETVRDPYAGNRETVRVSVFMNVFNVHSNRSPVDGRIERVEYFPGRFVNADLAKASEHNERNALLIRAHDGSLVTCVQVAGLVARRILCYVKPGEVLHRGQRFGFIRFGSRVDVHLPPGSRLFVGVGEKVHATASPLAELPMVAEAAAAAMQAGRA